MKKSILTIVLFSCVSLFSTAQAQDNRVRLKVNANYPVGLAQSYDSGGGIEADYSYTLIEHVELGASFADVFMASNANLYTLAFTPSASYTVDRFHFYVGPALGVLIDKENILAREILGQPSSYSKSEFAFGGFLGVDFQIVDRWSINVSYQYIRSFDTPVLSVSSFGGGVGFQF